jgi:hypothetical protein
MTIQSYAYEATDAATGRVRRLELAGRIVSFTDEAESGVVAHRVLQRGGAIHQRPGAPPERFALECVFTGDTAGAEYAEALAFLLAQPLGQLLHPRHQPVPAAFLNAEHRETPGDGDEVHVTLHFERDGVRELAGPSATASAAVAQSRRAALLAAAADQPLSIQSAAQALAVDTLASAISAVQTAAASARDLELALEVIRRQVKELEDLGASFRVRAEATLILGDGIEAQRALAITQPQVIEFVVPGVLSIDEICAQLYGASGRSMRPEVLRLNRIPKPYAVAAKTVLQVPSPKEVLRARG